MLNKVKLRVYIKQLEVCLRVQFARVIGSFRLCLTCELYNYCADDGNQKGYKVVQVSIYRKYM